MFDIQLMGLLNATLQAATLLFIAALGELITEKSGILNLGVEGMISIGAVTGFMTAINTGNIFLCKKLSRSNKITKKIARKNAKNVATKLTCKDIMIASIIFDLSGI